MSKNEIEYNRQVHDKVAVKYEKVHTEIFNEIEQTRLRKYLNEAVSAVSTGVEKPKALDVGCGGGNLTNHLIDLGCIVTAADISSVFLERIHKKYNGVTTHKLNGSDLSEIPDETFDIVATYSVLHHIPDYLMMVSEMCRVLKSGGVLYIDHERNELFWNNNSILLDFYRTQRPAFIINKLKRLLSPMWYLHRVRRLYNPRYQAEGDIHVWADDHIDWIKVTTTVQKAGLHVFSEMNFLLNDVHYSHVAYKQAKEVVTDTKAMIFRK